MISSSELSCPLKKARLKEMSISQMESRGQMNQSGLLGKKMQMGVNIGNRENKYGQSAPSSCHTEAFCTTNVHSKSICLMLYC